jgi:Ca2+-transporting ATPase
MVLYLLFFVTVAGVVVIAVDPGDPDVMHRPPRDPKLPITNRTAVLFWLLYAVVLFLAALTPLVVGPDQPSPDRPSASLTMTFVVMGLGTVFNALTNRRDPASGLTPPILTALAISVAPVVLLVLATEVGFLQRSLLTQELTGNEWLACIGLALALPVVIEASKMDPSIARAQAPRDRRDASGHTRPGPHRREPAIAAFPKPVVWAG